jgi:hypothetical protein
MGNMGWDEGGEYGEGTMGMGVGEMMEKWMKNMGKECCLNPQPT